MNLRHGIHASAEQTIENTSAEVNSLGLNVFTYLSQMTQRDTNGTLTGHFLTLTGR